MLEPKFHVSSWKNKDLLYNCILDKPIHSVDPWTTCSWVRSKRVKVRVTYNWMSFKLCNVTSFHCFSNLRKITHKIIFFLLSLHLINICNGNWSWYVSSSQPHHTTYNVFAFSEFVQNVRGFDSGMVIFEVEGLGTIY